MRIAIVALAVMLGACTNQKRPDAPAADADVLCYQACTVSLSDTGVRWHADPADANAWDALGETVVSELASRLLTCEASRRACAVFIQSLVRSGVIVAPPREPEQL
ncbi:hypothetical protein V3391_06560 [Luteimonas sp. SMYT11W]|uniref:Lipoprotein n=1 Tax=Luteimonas flava TaxID=3115822 RepID=A0ABU7WD35_9GAMM